MAEAYALDLVEVQQAFSALPIKQYAEKYYRSSLSRARQLLQRRDPDDVAFAALGLKLEIAIWSNDRDFEGLPIAVYPTAKLLKMLGL